MPTLSIAINGSSIGCHYKFFVSASGDINSNIASCNGLSPVRRQAIT